MNNPESVVIINRFFEALDILKASKKIRGIKTFTDRYGIDRWNFNKVRTDHKRDIFQLVWITYLIVDYGISSEWIFTGKGGMFTQIDSPIQ